MKQFFRLPAAYEGMRVRRLKHFGRIELLRTVDDPNPYWFIRIGVAGVNSGTGFSGLPI
jgi:hypothetical protein